MSRPAAGEVLSITLSTWDSLAEGEQLEGMVNLNRGITKKNLCVIKTSNISSEFIIYFHMEASSTEGLVCKLRGGLN